MAPKKNKSESGKVRRKRATIELKKEIIAKHENGVRVSDLASKYSMSKSTISTILKNKEVIKEANVAKGVNTLTKQRSQILEEVEKLLLIFINERQLRGDSISEAFICDKALEIYDNLVKKFPGTSETEVVFKASRGWFENFKHRSGIRSVVKHGYASNSDLTTSRKFVTKFTKLIQEEGYVPQQVFNADETDLFWKRMPKRTFITNEEKALRGHKPMKDRLTLLLCGNASGDFKMKPLLVYHSDNPRVFKKNNIIKSKLPVMWRTNSNVLVTRQYFVEWVHEIFAPSVKKYLQEQNLPIKCLLILDNAPAHLPDSEEGLVDKFNFIHIEYLPPDTTPSLQPMNQEIISNFKKLYIKAVFRKCFDITNDTRLTLKDFWKNHFHILCCVNLIDNAWKEVTKHTMNSGWKKLWPDCVSEQDFKGFNQEISDEIITIGQSLGLEVDSEDIKDLVEDHSTKITTEDLEHLRNDQQKTLTEDVASKEKNRKEDVSSSEINEICSKWADVQAFVEKSHPDTLLTNKAAHFFDDSVMSHFRKVLQKRQKQKTLDKSLLPTSKRLKRKVTPEV